MYKGQPDLLSALGGASSEKFDRLAARHKDDSDNQRLASEPSDAINTALKAKTMQEHQNRPYTGIEHEDSSNSRKYKKREAVFSSLVMNAAEMGNFAFS